MCRSCDFVELTKKKNYSLLVILSSQVSTCVYPISCSPGYTQHASCPSVNQVSQELHTKVVKHSQGKKPQT